MRTQKQLTGSIGVSPSKGALRQARRAAEYTPMPAAWLPGVGAVASSGHQGTGAWRPGEHQPGLQQASSSFEPPACLAFAANVRGGRQALCPELGSRPPRTRASAAARRAPPKCGPRSRSGPSRGGSAPLAFPIVTWVSMALLYGRAGRLTAKNGGFRPGQWTRAVANRRSTTHGAATRVGSVAGGAAVSPPIV